MLHAQRGWTCLHATVAASRSGRNGAAVAKLLIQWGADVTCQDNVRGFLSTLQCGGLCVTGHVLLFASQDKRTFATAVRYYARHPNALSTIFELAAVANSIGAGAGAGAASLGVGVGTHARPQRAKRKTHSTMQERKEKRPRKATAKRRWFFAGRGAPPRVARESRYRQGASGSKMQA